PADRRRRVRDRRRGARRRRGAVSCAPGARAVRAQGGASPRARLRRRAGARRDAAAVALVRRDVGHERSRVGAWRDARRGLGSRRPDDRDRRVALELAAAVPRRGRAERRRPHAPGDARRARRSTRALPPDVARPRARAVGAGAAGEVRRDAGLRQRVRAALRRRPRLHDRALLGVLRRPARRDAPARRRARAGGVRRVAAHAPRDGRGGGAMIRALLSTDHKVVAIRAGIVAALFFAGAGVLALLIRTELAQPGLQVVSRAGYTQLFTMHGSTMIFLVVIPIAMAACLYLVPLQVGT